MPTSDRERIISGFRLKKNLLRFYLKLCNSSKSIPCNSRETELYLKDQHILINHCFRVLKAPMGLIVPSKPPWMSPTLPRAQDPCQPQRCHSPAWPWAPQSQAHPWAHVLACPWPVPVPRGVPVAQGWGCCGDPSCLLLAGVGQGSLLSPGQPQCPQPWGAAGPRSPLTRCRLFREKWDLPYSKTRLNFITNKPKGLWRLRQISAFHCFSFGMGTVILQQITEVLQGLCLLSI